MMKKEKIKKSLIQGWGKFKVFFLPLAENNYRPHVLNGRFFTYLALILILAKIVTVFYLVYIPQTTFFSDIATSVLVKMTNQERNSVGAGSLKISPTLNQAALMKAQDMVANNYFSHWSPQGRSPWYWFQMAGYSYQYAGENLAIGFYDATDVHRAWLESSTHRANILNPSYQEMGLAVVEKDFYGRKSFLVVQMFGTPAKKETVAVTPVKKVLVEEVKVSEPEELLEVASQEETTILGEYDIGVYIHSAGFIEKTSFNLLHFFLLEYDKIIQKMIFLSLIFLAFILLVNVFVRFDVQHPDLIFKGLSFLAIFLVFEYFNQEAIVRIFLGTAILGG
jgi:hypothetical protein